MLATLQQITLIYNYVRYGFRILRSEPVRVSLVVEPLEYVGRTVYYLLCGLVQRIKYRTC